MEEAIVHFTYEDEDVFVGKSVQSDYLIAVLKAFKDFLNRVGYNYVDEIVAVCGNVEHSSEYDEEVE